MWAGLAQRYGVLMVNRRTAVRFLFGCPLSSNVVVRGHCLTILSSTINETVKWLSSLSIFIKNHSGGDSVALGRVPLFSHLLGSRSPAVPLRKQHGVKHPGFGPAIRLSSLFKNVVVSGHCLMTVALTSNETLKWFSSLPVLMKESFWR